MPKIKTKKSAAKRFKVLKSGKVKRFKAYKSHILTKKTQKRKRNLRKGSMMDTTNVKAVKKMMPYNF
jgi:large subunit ribosomal protein L35